ncbi:hypothetical protein ACFWBR_12145 [Streptomyces sp. NPDC060006]|uniref:hypothetical protein n=1 Tax=unclassified Streptomyces TaxID=2593676 RepID=UPI00368722F0
MLEAVVAVVGAVVGVAGVVTSYAGHRHSVREAARVASLERAVAERESRLVREASHRAEVAQASLVQVMMRSRRSPLAEQWAGWELQVTNGSDQPIREVAPRYDGLPLPTGLAGGLLHAGQGAVAVLPVSDVVHDPALGVVEFTDAAGARWRRYATGLLERGLAGGGWDGQAPNVAPYAQPGTAYRTADRPSGPPPSPAPARARLPRSVSVALVVAGAVLVAWAVWSLTR